MNINHYTHTQNAFSLIEVLGVVTGMLFLMATVILLNAAQSRCKSVRINCTNNLKQVALAFRMWSDDNGKYPMLYQSTNFDGPGYAAQQNVFIYFQAMSNELNTPKIVVCPGDTNRNAATNFSTDFNNSKVSYFTGLDADETMPQVLLAGDSNLTTNGAPVPSGVISIKSTDEMAWTKKRHDGQGNVALADGSVQGYTSPGINLQLQHSGTNLTRLAFP